MPTEAEQWRELTTKCNNLGWSLELSIDHVKLTHPDQEEKIYWTTSFDRGVGFVSGFVEALAHLNVQLANFRDWQKRTSEHDRGVGFIKGFVAGTLHIETILESDMDPRNF